MTTLTAPGTPSITLAAYSAPTFTAARVAIGNAATMIKLHGNGVDLPFTFGQTFVEGHLAPGDALTGRTIDGEIDLQMNVTATHNDGSIRHAIISGVIPKLAIKRDVWLIRSKPKAAGALVPRSPFEHYKATIVEGGKLYTARPGLVTGTSRDWLTGSVARETIYNVPFLDDADKPHVSLTAQFCVRDYKNNTKVDITVEHTKAYTTNGTYQAPPPAADKPAPAPVPAQVDVTYDAKHFVGGQVRYEQAGLVHFPGARWKKTYWRNGEPDVYVQHFTPYLIETKAVSAYDQRTVIDNTYLASLESMLTGPTFAPMGRGRFEADMAAAGGRPDLGLMPDSYAAYLLSGDKRAFKMMLASADAGGSWSGHRRDDSAGPAAGEPLDVIHWPRATLLGNLLDSKNPSTGQFEKMPPIVSASTLKPDEAHQPAFAYLPYLLTGDFYYMEEMKFWNHWNIYNSNPGYRDGARAVMALGQVRGQAWTLRSMAQCAAFLPDADPVKAASKFWLANTAEHYVKQFATPDGPHYNPLGATATEAAVAYTVAGVARTGLAPWQDDFLMSAFGHAWEITGLPALKQFALWKANFTMGRMTDPAFCWTDAAAYNLRVRDTGTSPIYTTFDQVYKATFPAAKLATTCCTPERLAYMNSVRALPSPLMVANEMTGYAGIVTGFPSNMQPALAYAVDLFPDRARAALAWQRYDTRANQPKYGTGPQFAMVPRAYTAAVILPAAPPPPVVILPENVMVTRSVSMLPAEWKAVDARGMVWLRQLIKLVG